MNPAASSKNHMEETSLVADGMPGLRKRALLLHSCCGPCSTSVVERLARDYLVTIFFYNPNITDEEEYKKRLEAQRSFIDIFNSSESAPSRVGLVTGSYEPGAFLKACAGYEDEPEGGARCERCISLRLGRTAEYASMHGYDVFSTTLSVSPHKNHKAISAFGQKLMLQYGVDFLADDFKKRDGFKRSIELSKAYGLYRQNYCGCIFSADHVGSPGAGLPDFGMGSSGSDEGAANFDADPPCSDTEAS